MKLGLIARADNSGLGTMSWELSRHIYFDQIKIVSNGRYKTFPERFYNVVDELDTDITVAIETPYDMNYWKGKRVLIPMYECTQPGIARKAHKIISVSLLDQAYYPDSTFLAWPTALDKIGYTERKKVGTLLHNAGHGGLGGRNGTRELIEALKFTKKDFKLIIQSQIHFHCDDPRVEVRVRDVENYWEMWGEGDVFIFPEKFNGLSLPIQEAMAAGYPIMCSDRYPFNAYLPKDIMIPVRSYKTEMIAVPFKAAVIEPEDIAAAIDAVVGQDLSKHSQSMRALAEMMSWEKLKPQWESEIKS